MSVASIYFINARQSRSGNFLRALTTTLYWKLYKGPRLIAVPNGKNVKNWIIRLPVSKSVMIGYDAVSETERVLTLNEVLIKQRGFMVQSSL